MKNYIITNEGQIDPWENLYDGFNIKYEGYFQVLSVYFFWPSLAHGRYIREVIEIPSGAKVTQSDLGVTITDRVVIGPRIPIDANLVQLLAKDGAQIGNCWDALKGFTRSGQVTCVQKLLELGAKSNDSILIQIACECNQFEVVDFFLNRSENFAVELHNTMYYCASNDFIGMMKKMFKFRESVAKEKWQETLDACLFTASHNGCLPMVELLLIWGADVKGGGMLHHKYAKTHGHTEVVKLLEKWIFAYGRQINGDGTFSVIA